MFHILSTTLRAAGLYALLSGSALAQEPERNTMVTSSARVGLSDAAQVVVIGISGRLNIRAQPSVRAPVIGQVPAATRLDTDGCVVRLDRLWCGIRWARGAGQRGWVAAEYLLPAVEARGCAGQEMDGTGRCSAPLVNMNVGVIATPYRDEMRRRDADTLRRARELYDQALAERAEREDRLRPVGPLRPLPGYHPDGDPDSRYDR